MAINFLAIIGTAHRRREPGKCSPDRTFYEYIFSRAVARRTASILTAESVPNTIDIDEDDLPRSMQTQSTSLERSRELGLRCNIVNELVRQQPGRPCVYVSIHVNADGYGEQFTGATGWQVSVSPYASQRTVQLANLMAEQAASNGYYVRRPLASQLYWVQPLKVLNDTACPAVLTENLFMTNRRDLAQLQAPDAVDIFARMHAEAILNYAAQVLRLQL